jgi:uncharacterized membrane protein
MKTITTEKSLPMAIGLNIILPGAGYMYMGRVVLGLAALLIVSGVVFTSGLLLILPTWLGLNVIMALDMVILLNKRKVALTAQKTRRCPLCAETIQRKAKICRFCHAELPASPDTVETVW